MRPALVLPTESPEAWADAFQRANTKPVVVMPGNTEIKVETQAFVYFNHDDPKKVVEPVVLSGDDADFRNAIQALAPLLSDADRAKYRDYIDPKMPKSLMRRYRDWRERNAR